MAYRVWYENILLSVSESERLAVMTALSRYDALRDLCDWPDFKRTSELIEAMRIETNTD